MDEKTATRTAPAEASPLSAVILNVPNQLTIARLILAVVCFVFLAVGWYMTALILFLLAATTDWIDGYWARRFNQVTQVGRILDPFADKLVVCGVFIFLAAAAESKIAPWMAVVVVAREMLVTAIRSFFEERGIDFSASRAGKWKMAFQCLAASFSLFRLTYLGSTMEPPPWLTYCVLVSVWIAVLMTIYSGWQYVQRAVRLLGHQ